ncbi:unnamed protein product [Acanthocheilonema viteae]|uniref:Uncharacterized protein n=1 Tax=Acanthocheilonema viteae TaxID=6277 RepID=A0A498S8U2_ACAVI|nr:unnamed protein product [Acanthocheilonema viteae]
MPISEYPSNDPCESREDNVPKLERWSYRENLNHAIGRNLLAYGHIKDILEICLAGHTTKHGFRIVLLNSFLETHLSPTQIPTLFVSAIPLKSGEPLVSKVFYPDSIREDKQVYLSDLREQSWYYICIEWENFNRYSETTGMDCRLLRTLDRFGKSADTTVEDVEVVEITATTMQFKIRSITNFPMRTIATLQGGNVPQIGSQVFEFRESSDLDVLFSFLKHDTEYGKLCIREEPLTRGYTSMGRYISGMSIEKCYFGKLKTKDYELSTYDMEASPYRFATSSARTISISHSVTSLHFLIFIFLTTVNCP